MSFDRRLHALVGVTLLGLIFSMAPPVRGQTTSASVSGSVQDSQGAILPGVTVTLRSRTQGNALTATSDNQGRFVFPIVRPDTYVLQVSLEGFKTLERTNVVVNANDKFFTGALTLEVGQMTEEITVTSRVSELQAQSGERSRWRAKRSRTSPTTDARSSGSPRSCRESFRRPTTAATG